MAKPTEFKTREEQLAYFATCVQRRDVSARQLSGGFSLVGVIRYLDSDDGEVVNVVQHEAVAAGGKDTAALITLFLDQGKFE